MTEQYKKKHYIANKKNSLYDYKFIIIVMVNKLQKKNKCTEKKIAL